MRDGSTTALRLRRALTDLRFPITRQVHEGLQEDVRAYVDDMKAQGWEPERVIVALKRLANDAGLQVSPRVVWSPEGLRGADGLIVEIVGWCIQCYYGDCASHDE